MGPCPASGYASPPVFEQAPPSGVFLEAVDVAAGLRHSVAGSEGTPMLLVVKLLAAVGVALYIRHQIPLRRFVGVPEPRFRRVILCFLVGVYFVIAPLAMMPFLREVPSEYPVQAKVINRIAWGRDGGPRARELREVDSIAETRERCVAWGLFGIFLVGLALYDLHRPKPDGATCVPHVYFPIEYEGERPNPELCEEATDLLREIHTAMPYYRLKHGEEADSLERLLAEHPAPPKAEVMRAIRRRLIFPLQDPNACAQVELDGWLFSLQRDGEIRATPSV
ncbi:MAG: hypothetical protein ACYTGH_14285 [Planctomycetota bacterium]|jgi:hypothetical protein